jgi:hypothetical protein
LHQPQRHFERADSEIHYIRQKKQTCIPSLTQDIKFITKTPQLPFHHPLYLDYLATFWISFDNDNYTADNTETKEFIKAISAAEYTLLFGYNPNYLTYLNGQPDVTWIRLKVLVKKCVFVVVIYMLIDLLFVI